MALLAAEVLQLTVADTEVVLRPVAVTIEAAVIMVVIVADIIAAAVIMAVTVAAFTGPASGLVLAGDTLISVSI